MNTTKPIDFHTMRENCIEVHQIVSDIFRVNPNIHIYTQNRVAVLHADDLTTNHETKSWDGLGRFAAYLYEDEAVWGALPETATIEVRGVVKKWVRYNEKIKLANAAHALGS